MFITQRTHTELVELITLPYERTVAAKHTARCLENAATSALENNPELDAAGELTWGAAYLDGGSVDCIC